MRILVLNTDYPAFLTEFYARSIGMASAAYDQQMAARNDSLFGVADFYSRGFASVGHQAWEIHANNGAMQLAWLRQQGRRALVPSLATRLTEFFSRRLGGGNILLSDALRLVQPSDLIKILFQQVDHYKPDVILNQSVSEISSHILKQVKSKVGLVVGQIASPMPDDEDYSAYDLMISSLPNYVNYYQQRGVRAALNRLAFDEGVLQKLPASGRDIAVSFVGSLTPKHTSRIELIEYLARETPIEIWGSGEEFLQPGSPIRDRHRGEAWGLDMFRLLGRSRITVNHHIGIAEDFANNMRLYEATGMGALLITDRKSNIADIFEPGKEIVCYEDHADCARLIRYYLDHEDERAAIAAAGQKRTLYEHTYRRRAGDLAALFAPIVADRR